MSNDTLKYLKEKGYKAMVEAKERVEKIITLVKGDDKAIGLIHDVLLKAQNYVDTVYKMETTIQMARREGWRARYCAN